MSDKPIHTYEVITSDGQQVEVKATGYSWSESLGVGRVLKLHPNDYKDKQGEFVNPQGIHRTVWVEEENEDE